LPESLALFLSINILGNGFAHDPMCRPMARLGQIFNTGARAHIEFHGHGLGGNVWLWHGDAPGLLTGVTLAHFMAAGF
jgi:hypothetical protein